MPWTTASLAAPGVKSTPRPLTKAAFFFAFYLVLRWRRHHPDAPVFPLNQWRQNWQQAAPSFTTAQLRLPVTLLLLAGITLFIMGQMLYSGSYPNTQWSLLGLMFTGLAAFLLAVRTIANSAPPQWLIPFTQAACHTFAIRPAQLVMLLLAPFFGVMARLAGGDVLLTPHGLITWTAWLIAIIFVTAGSLNLAQIKRPAPPLPRQELLIVLLLVMAAFLARGMATASYPNTLSGDEGSAGIISALFLQGKANNPLTLGWFSFPSFYFNIQGMSIGLLGRFVP